MTSLDLTVTDSEAEECMDPGENGAILNAREGEGPGPPRGGGKRTVGIRQWRRLGALEMLEGTRNGLGTTLNRPYAQSTYYICIMCNNP